MAVDTLIIGHIPLEDAAGRKPPEIRADAYFKELLAEFDLGTVHFASVKDWKAKSDAVNPLIIVILGNDYFGHEVRSLKKDALLYTTYDAGQIFYRKAETEARVAEHKKVFTEIAGHVKRAREGGDKEVEAMRRFAAMSFDDMYKMIVKAIIGEDEDLRKKAWALLNDKNVHSDFVWMRVKLVCDTWEHCDGKGKEEFLCMAMNQHIDEGLAYKMENFFEGDQEFHQYMFCYFDGTPTNYIRRIPVGFKGQEKYAYIAILDKYETPIGPRMMLEAGQMRSEKEKWAKEQCVKFAAMLKVWKTDPKKSMKELGVKPWYPYTEDDPLEGRELEGFKDFLKKYDSAAFRDIFPTD